MFQPMKEKKMRGFRLRYAVLWVTMLIVMLVGAACQPDDESDDSSAPAQSTPSNQGVVTATPPTTLTLPTRQPLPTLTPRGSTQITSNVPVEDQGTIRLVQAVPDLPDVDVYFDDNLLVPRVSAITISDRNNGIAVEAGTYNLRLVTSGAAPVEVLNQPVTIEKESAQIFIFTGSAAAIMLSIIPEALDPIDNVNEARAVFYHAGTGVETASLWEADNRLSADIAFNSDGEAFFLSPQLYNFQVISGTQTLTTLSLELRAGFAYTLIFLGDPASQNYKLLAFRGEPPPQTRIRFTQASAAVPAASVFLDEVPLAENIAFAASSEFSVWNTRRYEARVVSSIAAPGDPPLLQVPLTLNPNESIELVLLGDETDLRLQPYTIDTSPLPQDVARIMVINAVPEDLAGRVGLTTGQPFDDPSVLFGESTTSIFPLLEAGFIFESEGTTGTRLLELTDPVEFEAGNVYTYIPTSLTAASPIFLTTTVGTADLTVAEIGRDDERPTVSEGDFQVSVLNAMEPENDGFSVFAFDTEIIPPIQWGTISEPVGLEFGVNLLEMRLRDGTVFATQELVVQQANQFLIIVMGSPEAPRISVADNPDLRIGDNEVRLRVIHATSGLPEMAVTYRSLAGNNEGFTQSPTPEGTEEAPEVPDTPFAAEFLTVYSSSDIATLPPGPIEFTLIRRQAGENPEIAVLEPLILEGGKFYDLIFLAQGQGGYQVRLVERR